MKKNKVKSLEWMDYPEFKSYTKGSLKLNHGPAFGWLEITTACNIKCTHCYARQKEFKERYSGYLNKFMDMKTFDLWSKKILPHLHSVSLEGTVGESFLHPEIDFIISEVIRGETIPCIVTNGTIFKENTVKKIFNAGGRIVVSLDGITSESFNKIRKGADFKEVWGNIVRLDRLKEGTPGQLYINTVFQKDNWFELEELIKTCLLLKMDRLIINEIFISDIYDTAIKSLSIPEEGMNYILKCQELFKNNQRVYFNIFSRFKSHGKTYSCCSPWMHIWTGIYGQCRICCVGDEVYWNRISERFISDEFRITSFMNKKEFVIIRKNMLKGIYTEFCKNCHMIWGVNSPILNG